jgi:hypothetical protein
MRFLHNLFKRYPKRDHWASIANCISMGLQNARKEWFSDVCMRQIESFHKCGKTSPGRLNNELSGQVVLTMKAYQVGTVPGFIEKQRYIAKSQTVYFADLIVGQVCGTEVAEIDKASDQFSQLPPDMVEFHLARRVAEHLTGKEANLPDIALLVGMVPAFVLCNRMAVASAFGDKPMMATIDKRIDEWIKGLPDHFRDVHTIMTAPAKAA